MTARLLKNTGVLTFIVGLALADGAGAAQTTWSVLAPSGARFSIEVPGTAKPDQKPGHFVYNADEWAYFVTINPVSDAVREFVGAADRVPIRQFLERLHQSFLKTATERTLSEADFAGYPSVRFSADGETDDKQAFQGQYWLVVTEEHLYMLMAIGPKGSSSAGAERFLGSFRLDKARESPPVNTSSKGMLATVLEPPMLAVALLITEQRLNPLIDQMLQRSPAATRLGSRWNSTHPAWQKARTALTGRVAQIALAYEKTGEMERTFAAEVERVAPGAQADAIVAMLISPAGLEILREYALIEFTSTIMADDPNGPNAGEPAWRERSTSLAKIFDEQFGSFLPRDKAREAEAGKVFSTPSGELFRNLWSGVIEKAASQIQGAANLALFDDRDAINREIEAAIASVK
jgi:hypothetical protein